MHLRPLPSQVYERSAIERHMRINHTDPLTNSQLASDVLTPVFPMRSRAAAYREQAAAAAAARAAAPDCAEPLKYLRRAAELLAPCYAPPTAGGLPMAAPKVAGLSADFVRYLQQNHGAAYDTLALKYYANELRRGERAACGSSSACAALRLVLACVRGGGLLSGATLHTARLPAPPPKAPLRTLDARLGRTLCMACRWQCGGRLGGAVPPAAGRKGPPAAGRVPAAVPGVLGLCQCLPRGQLRRRGQQQRWQRRWRRRRSAGQPIRGHQAGGLCAGA